MAALHPLRWGLLGRSALARRIDGGVIVSPMVGGIGCARWLQQDYPYAMPPERYEWKKQQKEKVKGKIGHRIVDTSECAPLFQYVEKKTSTPYTDGLIVTGRDFNDGEREGKSPTPLTDIEESLSPSAVSAVSANAGGDSVKGSDGGSSVPSKPAADSAVGVASGGGDVANWEPPEYKEQKDPYGWRGRLAAFLFGGMIVMLCHSVTDVTSPWMQFGAFLLRQLDPEVAHRLVILAASRNLTPVDFDPDDPMAIMNVCGMRFVNPIGLAAGLDKHAEGPLALAKMGFGFIEIGSVTPQPQPGNPKPRVFRLPDNYAVINRYGFNSEGVQVVAERLRVMREGQAADPLGRYILIGANLGKNKMSPNAASDMCEGVRHLGRYADFLVLNVSSPNTPGLRSLQGGDELEKIVGEVQKEISRLPKHPRGRVGLFPVDDETEMDNCRLHPALFVKIAPDLCEEEMQDIANVVLRMGVDGIIVTNTTVQRPEDLKGDCKDEVGGLSGLPLRDMSTKCVYDMYKMTEGKIPIIACGGVFTGKDAMDKIEAGASLVELYTSMIYRGPVVGRLVKEELSSLMIEKGYYELADAVGAAHRPPKPKKRIPKPAFGIAFA